MIAGRCSAPSRDARRHSLAESTRSSDFPTGPGLHASNQMFVSSHVLPGDPAMNRLRLYLAALLLGACVWLPALPSVADEERGRITSYPFRDSFARHYPVKGSPRIVIKGGISGPVIISSGRTGMVDIDVTRTAATQQELDCHEVKIDSSPDLITITQVQFDRRECKTIRASQSLTLRVPSNALLDVSGIAGELQVTGPVQSVTAKSIASHVSISGAGTVDLLSLAGGLSLGIGSAPGGSATVESVMGDVELNVGERRDVEIRISSLNGHLRSVPPEFVSRRTNNGYLLRGGERGSSLSIISVQGDVVVRRD